MFFGYKNFKQLKEANPDCGPQEYLESIATKTEINVCNKHATCWGYDGEYFKYSDDSKDKGQTVYKYTIDRNGNRYIWLDR